MQSAKQVEELVHIPQKRTLIRASKHVFESISLMEKESKITYPLETGLLL